MSKAVQDTLKGHATFQHKPPTADYRSVADWIMENHPDRTQKQRHLVQTPRGIQPSLSQRILPSLSPDTAVVRLYVCSGWQTATISTDDESITETFSATSLYPSAVADRVKMARDTGAWYYEVTVRANKHRTEGSKEEPAAKGAIGFATRRFFGNYMTGEGVGDDEHSWGLAFTSEDKQARTGSVIADAVMVNAQVPKTADTKAPQKMPSPGLKDGDVVGCLLDTATGVGCLTHIGCD